MGLAACTSAASPPISLGGIASSDTIPPNSWVDIRPTDALLIQYTRNGGNIQGTVDESYLRQNGQSLASNHVAVLGIVSGTNLTLQISGTSYSGSLSESSLTLNLPDQSTGGVVTVNLHPGSTAEYNAGVASLRATAAANADAAAKAQASAQAASQLQGASDAVANDIDKLQAMLSKGVDFSALNADISQANSDLQTTRADANKAIGEGSGNPDACVDAGTASVDAGTVEVDQGTIQVDSSSVQTTIDDVNQLVAALKRDYTTFQAVAASQRQSIDAAQANVVQSWETKAANAVSQWKGQLASYASQAQTLVDQANAAADAANKAVC
jgi:hypothetical protein